MSHKAKKRMVHFAAVIVAAVVMICFIPQTVLPVSAASGDPAMVFGAEDVLKDTANTDAAQTVWYAGKAWRVISFDGTGNKYTNPSGAMTLFSSDILSTEKFYFDYTTHKANYYKDSYLQTEVNKQYNNLFSDQEKEAVINRTLEVGEYDAKNAPYSTGVKGDKTSGYLWPLSTAEALELPSDKFRSATKEWWLRSPGWDYSSDDMTAYWAAYVDKSGVVFRAGTNVRHEYGVRPAFDLDLDYVLLTSAAEDGKVSGEAGADALQAVSTNTTDEWKLTLHDSSRDGFDATAAADAVLSQDYGYTSWSVPIVFSGASDANDNDYVSVILADSDNNILYYGNIANKTAASPEEGQGVTIPEGLDVGDYKLYVFSEQVNGDKLTDYAGKLCSIDLKVNVAEYPLWVGDTQVTSSNTSGTGWSYDAASRTLTLDGYTASSYHDYGSTYGIYYSGKDDLTIDISGDCKIGSDNDAPEYGIYGRQDSSITFKGDGTLEVKTTDSAVRSNGSVNVEGGMLDIAAGGYAVYGKKGVSISGGTVKAVSNDGAAAISSGSLGDVSISGGTVYAASSTSAITSSNDVKISGGTVQAAATISSNNNVEITGGTVTVEEKSGSGIVASKGYVIIGEDAKLTSAGGKAGISWTVKNSVPGTGWTDVEGTGDGEIIYANSDGQDLSSLYKKVVFPCSYGKVTWDEPDNGTITASKTAAVEGETITLTVTPGQTNWKVGSVTVTNLSDSTEVSVMPDETDPHKFTFKMPDADVKVNAKIINNCIYVYFKVVNGTWDDGSTDVKEVKSGLIDEGSSYTLQSDDIPAAGSKPDAGYKEGSWDVTPDISTQIYKDTTYTYTYTAKTAIDPAVSIADWTVGDEASEPAVTGNSGGGAVTYSYKVRGADDSTYTETVPDAAGDYTIRAVIAETDDYRGGEATADFTISKKIISKAAITIKAPVCGDSNTPDVTIETPDDGSLIAVARWRQGNKATEITGGETYTAYVVLGIPSELQDTCEYADDAEISVNGETIEPSSRMSAGVMIEKEFTAEHDWGDWTGLNDTQHRRVCRSDSSHTETASHSWDKGKVTKEPTTEETGIRTYTCADCGATRTESIAKLTPDKDTTAEKTTAAKPVLVAKGIASGQTAVNISWNKVSGADRYVVYMAKCNYKGKKYSCKKVKVTKSGTLKFKKTKLAKKTAYKFYVVAQKKVNGKYANLAKSKMGHFITGNFRGKYTNPKKLELNKTKVTLSVGKSTTIKGTVTKVKKGKKLVTSHAKKLRFKSNNPAVATVSASGRITAKSRGTAKIYVQTINGIWKICKVTVK